MTDDKAGPLLGWSIGNGVAAPGGRPIDDLVTYPCTFRFKAVAKAEPGVVADLVKRIEAVLGRAVAAGAWTTRDSSGGKYVALTIDVDVTSGQQVYDLYEALRADPRVTHLL
jgi:putative lipoic acid-binding regulatory protein